MAKSPSPSASRSAWSRWHVAVTETFDGVPLCLSLTNTRNWRNGPAPVEHLNDYVDVLRWGERRDLVDAGDVARLTVVARDRPRVARAELAATIALREAVYRVFSARAHGRAPAAADVASLCTGFNEAVAQLELAIVDGRLMPAARRSDPGPETMRLNAALSAVSLLTSDVAPKVKECADDRGCGWLFVDSTRNGSRRFCFSSECGNRARQAAFRERHRLDPVRIPAP